MFWCPFLYFIAHSISTLFTHKLVNKMKGWPKSTWIWMSMIPSIALNFHKHYIVLCYLNSKDRVRHCLNCIKRKSNQTWKLFWILKFLFKKDSPMEILASNRKVDCYWDSWYARVGAPDVSCLCCFTPKFDNNYQTCRETLEHDYFSNSFLADIYLFLLSITKEIFQHQ